MENLSPHRVINQKCEKVFFFVFLAPGILAALSRLTESKRSKAPLLPRSSSKSSSKGASSDALVLFSAFFFTFFTRIQKH